MPIMTCQKDGKPGYKYGETGTCYPYKKGSKASEAAALAKAKKQGRAIEMSKHERGR